MTKRKFTVIWDSCVSNTRTNPAGYVISPEMAQFHRRPTDSWLEKVSCSRCQQTSIDKISLQYIETETVLVNDRRATHHYQKPVHDNPCMTKRKFTLLFEFIFCQFLNNRWHLDYDFWHTCTFHQYVFFNKRYTHDI
jgi:hypothetical protein